MFWNTIIESCKDKFNQMSHTRISSYFILASIILNVFVFMGIDITNLIIAYHKNEYYHVPVEHIAIFGMVLTHHLILLGLKKASETKQTKIEADIEIEKNKNVNDNSTDEDQKNDTETTEIDPSEKADQPK